MITILVQGINFDCSLEEVRDEVVYHRFTRMTLNHLANSDVVIAIEKDWKRFLVVKHRYGIPINAIYHISLLRNIIQPPTKE